MATLRELKGRIGSVASSEKLTGAMKMISSAKMHKAEQSLRRLKPFRSQIESIIGNVLTADAEVNSPLLEAREVKQVSIVVFGSDDGLCGAYNVNIFKQLLQHIAEVRKSEGEDVKFCIYPVGAKIAKAVARICSETVRMSVIDGIDSKTSGEGIRDFTAQLQEAFTEGKTDRVDILYMNFQSASRQRPTVDVLLPVVASSFDADGEVECMRPYIFEPSPSVIFNSVLPMFILAVMQDAFTENRASELAARIMAMQSANDNAKKLLEELQLEYNKLRQQGITNELLDILGGQVRD